MYPRVLHKEPSRHLMLNNIISPVDSTIEVEVVEPISDRIDEAKIRKERENKPTTTITPAGKKTTASDEDKLKSIAMNSREIRLVGPDGKEVEMKDDVPTKIIVAFENLQKEASQVWDQVNTKLDKGWTEFKTMVERAVKPTEKKSSYPEYALTASDRSLLQTPDSYQYKPFVLVRDADSYSFADEQLTKGAQSQADSAGDKIKSFFSDTMGINEDNTKKAGDALSKAGTAVSDTMTKDLPEALKKASSAVSDTVTKDIPDAFKNFFG